jgi:hypothetical protein
MYTVLMSTIAISNIYISGLSKMEEVMYYQHFASEYIDTKEDIEVEVEKEIDLEEKVIEKEIEEELINEDLTNEEDFEETINVKSDLDIIYDFKVEIYDIEKIALVPMRDCLTYTKNVSQNLKKLAQVREDLDYARKKCIEAIEEYENMTIPIMSKEEYTSVLKDARDDLIKTYELREKAMQSALDLVDTKNPKHIGKLNEYLKLSDNHITSFKERLNDLKIVINNNK